MIASLIDIVLHLDVHLSQLALQMGPWTYFILFVVIFAETGLIVTPLLPGDSLLFAAGSIASLPDSGLDVKMLWILLICASFLGDNVNYSIGRWIGPKIFNQPRSKFTNPAHLRRAHEFYTRHGGRTVFIARFLPILRTFAPFIAGVGGMDRKLFMTYSAAGSVVWMTVFLGAGFGFGNIPWVQHNFSAVIMVVLILPLMPVLIEMLRGRVKSLSRHKRF